MKRTVTEFLKSSEISDSIDLVLDSNADKKALLANDVNTMDDDSQINNININQSNAAENVELALQNETPLASSALPTQQIQNRKEPKDVKRSSNKLTPRKPVTAWMIYCQENRERIRSENPSLSFLELSKILGEQYQKLSNDELERIKAIVSADKDRYMREIETVKSSDTKLPSSTKPVSSDLILTYARIKRIVKLDPDVKSIAKEGTHALARVTELFIGFLSKKAASVAMFRGTRTIRDIDVIHAIQTNECFEFLRLDFPKHLSLENQRQSSNMKINRPTSLSKSIIPPLAPNSRGSIASYFSDKNLLVANEANAPFAATTSIDQDTKLISRSSVSDNVTSEQPNTDKEENDMETSNCKTSSNDAIGNDIPAI